MLRRKSCKAKGELKGEPWSVVAQAESLQLQVSSSGSWLAMTTGLCPAPLKAVHFPSIKDTVSFK